MSTMESIVNRAANFAGAYGNVRVTPAQVDDLARARLCVTAATEQLELFAHWCYQRHENGLLLHVCNNGQIPSGGWTPWGSSGKSGLTRTERDVLRVWLHLVWKGNHKPVWFYYDKHYRWYVDFTHYPSVEAALLWLEQHPIHPQDWLDIHLRMKRVGARSVSKYVASRQRVGRGVAQ